MQKHFLVLALGTAYLPGCVPGRVLVAPPLEATVIDLRTVHPLAGASINVVDSTGSADKPLVEGVSDARGRFTSPARYAFGLVPVLGDSVLSRITVRVSRAGYEDYGFTVGPTQTLRVYADMESERDATHNHFPKYFAR